MIVPVLVPPYDSGFCWSVRRGAEEARVSEEVAIFFRNAGMKVEYDHGTRGLPKFSPARALASARRARPTPPPGAASGRAVDSARPRWRAPS